MNTVTYNTRIMNETETVSNSRTCTEYKANLYLNLALSGAKGYGYNTASGDGWFTGTNPDNGNSITCTITH